MSRKACSPDNAACEGVFGRLKTEPFYPRDWQATTIEQFVEAVDSYIRYYSEKRIKISLARSAPSNTARALDLRHKPVQVLIRIPQINNQALQINQTDLMKVRFNQARLSSIDQENDSSRERQLGLNGPWTAASGAIIRNSAESR